MRHYRKPAKVKRDSRDGILAVAPSIYKHEAPDWVEVLDWIARGTRPEVIHTVQTLATRLLTWSAKEDAMLEHLFGYLYIVCAQDFVHRRIWVTMDGR